MTIAHFIFDPLCGWCYGAVPVLDRMRADGFGVELLPMGRTAEVPRVEGEFSGLIWETDRLVAKHTGQPFTRAYRCLLNGGTAWLDAWPATLAIIAVARTRPDRQMAALHALQIARFVNGRDTGDAAVVETILREVGLHNAADLCAASNPVLVAAAEAATRRAGDLLAEHGADGGPAVLLTGEDSPRLLGAKVLIARAAAQRSRLDSAAEDPRAERARPLAAIPTFA
nr:hypothetical protein [uncultured Roseococcus sp.]